MSRRSTPLSSLLLCSGLLSLACTGKQGAPRADLAESAKTRSARTAAAAEAAKTPRPEITGDRLQVAVPADAPRRGAEAPLVTIVEFSDFECPFCGRLAKTLDTMLPGYDKDVQLVFRHYPLPKHANAEPAAKASLAAHRQGKFWEMHDRLFADQSALTPADLSKHAEALQLDMAQFRKDMADLKSTVAINNEFADGRVLNVSTTPSFFVNGRLVTGAKPAEEIALIIDEEITLANALIASGVERSQIYAEIMKVAKPGTGKRPNRDPTHRRGEASKKTNYAMSTGADSPARGPADAWVTIVAFNAFTCDTCQSVAKDVERVRAKYPADVRVVWRHFPDGDPAAQGAARASVAAHQQGKFWEMHDKLFAGRAGLNTVAITKMAGDLGLDRKKFVAALGDAAVGEAVDADQRVANKLRGTAPAPFLWVNGRIIDSRDAPTEQDIETLVLAEKTKAEAFAADKGVARSELYEAMRKTWRGYTIIETAEGR